MSVQEINLPLNIKSEKKVTVMLNSSLDALDFTLCVSPNNLLVRARWVEVPLKLIVSRIVGYVYAK